jgi:hypothetical protein
MSSLENSKNVRIECSASRGPIQIKKFKLKKNKKLIDLQEILITVFELEGMMTKFRFFYQGK